MVMTAERRTYTIEQLAEFLQVNERVVYNLIHDGTLPAVRVGRQYRVTSDVFEAFLRGELPAREDS